MRIDHVVWVRPNQLDGMGLLTYHIYMPSFIDSMRPNRLDWKWCLTDLLTYICTCVYITALPGTALQRARAAGYEGSEVKESYQRLSCKYVRVCAWMDCVVLYVFWSGLLSDASGNGRHTNNPQSPSTYITNTHTLTLQTTPNPPLIHLYI